MEARETMVTWDDMTEAERDRLIYLVLTEEALRAITLLMYRKHGPAVTTEQIMRFAFRVAVRRMYPR